MARPFRPASPLPLPSSSTTGGSGSGSGSGSFPWLLKKRSSKPAPNRSAQEAQAEAEDQEAANAYRFPAAPSTNDEQQPSSSSSTAAASRRKRADALARLRSAFRAALAHHRRRRRGHHQLGSSVTGTIFGRRRGRVHVALQSTDPRAAASGSSSSPVLLVELAAYSTGALVREMSSGLVRLALECEKSPLSPGEKRRPLLEEPTWRAYCNGRKCGYAVRRECGADEWRVLAAVEPVSVGAGVLPDDNGGGGGNEGEGDLMYMRARFERVVGSRDSEAFYMMNPDGSGGPELSIYLLRV